MLITVVTYQRPQMAAEIYRHLLDEIEGLTASEEPCRVIIYDNGGDDLVRLLESQGESFRKLERRTWADGESVAAARGVERPDPYEYSTRIAFREDPLVEIWSGTENLGAGVARNRMLRERGPTEPFIRMDDDWLPSEPGWLAFLTGLCPDSNLVRLAPSSSIEPGRRGLSKGTMRWRLPDTCGPIWCVGGRLADELGFFDTRFGPTLFDDLEYSRRAVQWRRNFMNDQRGILELGWPHRDLASLGGRGPSSWNPDWELFKQHCAELEAGAPLHVTFDQKPPGWYWEANGKTFKETT